MGITDHVFSKEFSVGSELYHFFVDYRYEVLFGRYEYDCFAWEIEDSLVPTSELKKSIYGVEVFSKVYHLLKIFIFEIHPPYFYFSASDSKKRLSVYHKMCLKLAKKIGYSFVESEGNFYFYKEL